MLILNAPETNLNVTINLNGSKSITNRILILGEVFGLNMDIQNASTSEDTHLLKNALAQIKNKTSATIDIHHAGTDMRFLTAFLSTKNGEWILTGSERMKQRPIGELVNSLRGLGAEIDYLEKENFPPLKIKGKPLKGGKITMDGSISSQFVSALLLISPALGNGLEITLKNAVVSWPYILMTLDLLSEFNMKVSTVLNTIKVSQNTKHETRNRKFIVESDWSSASYWYSIVALSENAKIILKGLTSRSLQGDSVLPEIYRQFGVSSEFDEKGVIITKSTTHAKSFEYDFKNCPDLAQTVAVTCFGLGVSAHLKGLQTLKLKESDRIIALKTELEKFGGNIGTTPHSLNISGTRNKKQETILINTYNDHRMAMSFAPLSLVYSQIAIQDPEVVSKSYPLFWEDLKSVGFSVNLQP